MTDRRTVPETPGAARPERSVLRSAGERAGFGVVLAALGFCCATALLGPAAVAGAVGLAMGALAGLVTGAAWLIPALVVAGSVFAAWLVRRSRRPRSR